MGVNKWIYCNNCKRKNEHEFLIEEEILEPYDSDGDEFHLVNIYKVFRCPGCRSLTIFHQAGLSEDWVHPDQEAPIEIFYPPREKVKADVYYSLLPKKVNTVYNETINAINNDLNILGALGLRTLVEAIGKEFGLGSKLKVIIKGFAEQSHLTETQTKHLDFLRDIGNAATHEVYIPSDEELISAFNIIELTMKTLYVSPKIADALHESQVKRALERE